MSQIAAALARSKGKKVEPVPSDASIIPEIHTSAPPMPFPATPAAPKKINARRIAFVSAAVALIACIVWLTWPSAPDPVASHKNIPGGNKPTAKPTTASVRASPSSGQTAALETNWDPKLEEQIMKLPITARRPGAESRIVIGKKIYEPGDTVIEGAILEAVYPDRIVFRDAQNRLLERRF